MDPKLTKDKEAKKSESDEAEVTDAPKDPKTAAGSINPKEKGPFYEAVLKRQPRRKGN